MKRSIIVIALTASIGIGSASRAADELTEAQQASLNKIIDTCATCHGANGRSVAPTFPNLAAQTAPYIEAQLHAFKDQTRGDPDAQAYMWGMAAPLGDSTITALAAYYASKPAPESKSGAAALIAQGKRVFEEGVPSRQIPPCASCHGQHAQGQGPIPRLAGQHAPYLLKQLLAIQSALRAAPVMHGIVKDLTKEQMQAVVAYLASI